jgi:hypothetical protein
VSATAILSPTLPTPTADTFVLADAGGTLPDSTTYYYRVSAINAAGETLAFAEVSQATGTGGTGDEHVITVAWEEVEGASGYRVYGRATGAQELMAEVDGGDTLSWDDDGSVTPDGALPEANTTAGQPGTSEDVVVAAGASVSLGVYTTGGQGIPGNDAAGVYMDTPGDDVCIYTLSGANPVQLFNGPATYRVKRGYTSGPLGVFKEV